MKLVKLNQRGFSHELLLVLVVGFTAILGVGYMVASQAVTGQNGESNKVLGASVKKQDLKCKILGVSKKPRFGDQISPKVKITNTSKSKTISIQPYASLLLANSNRATVAENKKQIESITLKPRKSKTVLIPIKPFAAQYQTPDLASGYYAVGSNTIEDPFVYCTANFTLPSPK